MMTSNHFDPAPSSSTSQYPSLKNWCSCCRTDRQPASALELQCHRASNRAAPATPHLTCRQRKKKEKKHPFIWTCSLCSLRLLPACLAVMLTWLSCAVLQAAGADSAGTGSKPWQQKPTGVLEAPMCIALHELQPACVFRSIQRRSGCCCSTQMHKCLGIRSMGWHC